MVLIITLILIGILMLVAELVLLPGLSVAGFCALGAYGGAIYLGFSRFGNTGGWLVIAAVIILSVIATYFSLKAKTWQRFSLKQKIDSTSQVLPQDKNVKVGDRGIAITRLAPMGKIAIGDETYEAKTQDAYVDQKSEIEVIGFENFSVLVKAISNN